MLIAVLLAPLALFLLPSLFQTVVGVLLSVVMLAWLLRGRTLRLHGAEHRAIAAVEQGKLVSTWSGITRPSRFAARCGTNFAALVLPVAVVFDRIAWSLPAAAVAILSLSLTMELWVAIEGRTHRVARAFLVPGLLLQRLTTREPRLDETQVALRATASVLRRELADTSSRARGSRPSRRPRRTTTTISGARSASATPAAHDADQPRVDLEPVRASPSVCVTTSAARSVGASS